MKRILNLSIILSVSLTLIFTHLYYKGRDNLTRATNMVIEYEAYSDGDIAAILNAYGYDSSIVFKEPTVWECIASGLKVN